MISGARKPIRSRSAACSERPAGLAGAQVSTPAGLSASDQRGDPGAQRIAWFSVATSSASRTTPTLRKTDLT